MKTKYFQVFGQIAEAFAFKLDFIIGKFPVLGPSDDKSFGFHNTARPDINTRHYSQFAPVSLCWPVENKRVCEPRTIKKSSEAKFLGEPILQAADFIEIGQFKPLVPNKNYIRT